MKPHVSKVTALFLLSQVFLIITHVPLVRLLAWIIFHGDANIFTERGATRIQEYSSTTTSSTASSTASKKRTTIAHYNADAYDLTTVSSAFKVLLKLLELHGNMYSPILYVRVCSTNFQENT